ncbi:MAG: TolC family protein [Deltaproteobacteria bacterium]|nr:TolC family protein [Deltaproteobacteria bacterium]
MRFVGLVTILALFLPLPLRGQEGVLTLDEAVVEVLANNPDILAAGYRSAAARAKVGKAKALDDPMVGVTFDDVPLNTANVKKSEEINYRIEQKIPFPGKRYVKGKVARFEAKAVAENSRGQTSDVILDLKKTYYETYRVDRSLEVNRENQKLLRQFLGSTETRYATGQTTADAPLKAQVELSKLANEEISLEQERVTHEAHLKALMNRHIENELRLPKTLVWPRLQTPLEEVKEKAFEMRPELGTLRQMRNRDRSQLTAARQGLIPDFSLGFMYGQRPLTEDTWTATAMINLPIFFWGKNRAEIREAKASLKATEAESASMEVHTEHEIQQAYSAVQSSQKIITKFEKEILPQAKTSLEAARLAYSTNKIDFMTLTDAARTYKELQFSYYENQARLGTSFAELERLSGTTFKEGEKQ